MISVIDLPADAHVKRDRFISLFKRLRTADKAATEHGRRWLDEQRPRDRDLEFCANAALFDVLPRRVP